MICPIGAVCRTGCRIGSSAAVETIGRGKIGRGNGICAAANPLRQATAARVHTSTRHRFRTSSLRVSHSRGDYFLTPATLADSNLNQRRGNPCTRNKENPEIGKALLGRPAGEGGWRRRRPPPLRG